MAAGDWWFVFDQHSLAIHRYMREMAERWEYESFRSYIKRRDAAEAVRIMSQVLKKERRIRFMPLYKVVKALTDGTVPLPHAARSDA